MARFSGGDSSKPQREGQSGGLNTELQKQRGGFNIPYAKSHSFCHGFGSDSVLTCVRSPHSRDPAFLYPEKMSADGGDRRVPVVPALLTSPAAVSVLLLTPQR